MRKYLQKLQGCPLFAQIEEDNLLRMLTCLGAGVEQFDKKHTIFAEGGPAKQIGILLSGAAQVIRIDYYGNRSILTEISPGEVFAEAFACAEAKEIPVSIIADAPSEVMLIDSAHILHTCSNHCGFHQQLIYNLMKDLATKTMLFHQKVEITSKRSTRDKLLTYLAIQAKKDTKNYIYDMRPAVDGADEIASDDGIQR